MGLIDAMQRVSGGTAPYHWKGAQPQRFDVTVSEGTSRVASGGFTRRGAAPGVAMRAESIAATGFYGQFWAPHIRGPVFLDCGTDDHVWTSCAYALRIEDHLTAGRFAYPHVLYRYRGAGHYVNLLVPYQPGEILADLASPTGQGNTLLANADAHARLWPQLLSFLAHPHSTGVFTHPATAPRLTASAPALFRRASSNHATTSEYADLPGSCSRQQQ